MASNAIVVLKGRGGTFRLGKSEIEVFRGGLSRRVPLAALTGHQRSGRSVVLTTATETYEVQGGNDASVTAFTDALERAMRRVEHDPAATTTSTTQPRKPLALAAKVALGAGVAVLLLVWWAGPVNGLIIAAGFGVLCGLATAALFGLRGVWRWLLRDLWVLRRRGVTVAGEITGYRHSSSDQTKYAKLRFVTATGRSMEVESAAFVFLRRRPGPADITYDPENPKLATGQPAIGHLLAGLFSGVVCLGLLAAAMTGIVLMMLTGLGLYR
ncbi:MULTISPECIES: DUF3592 domain-containing protein [unclassified Crossiella]|uniref:DUF3592 domain-containing protein n=1 Tax=unclassified Crossiella TaxID=2620835 RepID=UPI001FFE81C2|nr:MULTISPECIES: DUF3592 domain-containing protein [unclassified Crossiella]MCK2237571.1 DUF3592 domain-containing protein [Crossiella sp. S99.2]MCK2254857.1 DUF3592 domain-containing protein [Crossiella sp. S99.1]